MPKAPAGAAHDRRRRTGWVCWLSLCMYPTTKPGTIRLGSGPASGGVDSFFASILGHGGHGAQPHETVDPVYLAGHVILALHGIVSRRLDPMAPAVITIGSLHGGDAENVIPDEVKLSGKLRCFLGF